MKATLGAAVLSGAALGLVPFPAARLEVPANRAPAAHRKAAPAAENLVITSAVRASLVDAGASHFGLPASDFLGLGAAPAHDPAYYAYDRASSSYWAGASLVPNPKSYDAGVVVQDDGAYLIFDRSVHGSWQVHDVGYSDSAGTCSAYHVSIPVAVVAVWDWVPGTCHPPVPAASHSGTAANLTVTTTLRAQVRTAFFHAYRLDPKPMAVFGVPAGLPESRVVEPTIEHAGVIDGSSPSADSFWVVADICFDIPTGCEDAGAFQVFHREGSSGAFTYLELDLCVIPAPLATLWFPHGRYPMGERCTKAAPAMTRQPVLGSASFIPRIGVGWGTYKPKEIFNGGDPSGLIDEITWIGWGKPESVGYGKTFIPKPNGGYYPRDVTAELRASDLGHCTAGGPLAYETLEVREPSAPGGKLGPWFVWDRVKTLCRTYS